MYYIYIYFNPLIHGDFTYGKYCFKHEPFYIGMSKSKKRHKQHLYEVKSGITKNKLKTSIIKRILEHGTEPVIKILYKNLTQGEASKKERELILLIGRKIKNNGPLSNILRGGQLINSNKISKSLKENKSINNDKQRAVLQYDLQGNFINEYKSVKNAKEVTKCSHLDACCRGKRNSAGGFIWRYKDDKYFTRKKYKARKDRPWNKFNVYQYNEKMELINKYDSIYDLPSVFNKRMVKQSCRKHVQYKSYYFKYKKI